MYMYKVLYLNMSLLLTISGLYPNSKRTFTVKHLFVIVRRNSGYL